MVKRGGAQVGAVPQVFTPFNGWEDFDPSNTLVLTARDGEPLMLTSQQVQQLTWDEFKDLWRVGAYDSAFAMSGQPRMFALFDAQSRLILVFLAEWGCLLSSHSSFTFFLGEGGKFAVVDTATFRKWNDSPN